MQPDPIFKAVHEILKLQQHILRNQLNGGSPTEFTEGKQKEDLKAATRAQHILAKKLGLDESEL